MPQIFSDWQAAYAERGLPTFPINPIADGGRRKLPSVRHYDRIGLRASQQLALKFIDANGIACMAGARNKLTIIDIDARGAEADRLMADAQRLYGRSRFIVRSGRGGLHAYYKHSGEGRKIRPNPTQPIDILGGGVVVLPPSLGAEHPYQIVEGHLDDLTTLTKIRRAPMPDTDKPVQRDIPPMPDIPRIDLTGMREGDGRNPKLFDIMCANGMQLPPTLEAFIDFARDKNMTCAEPMDDDEVMRVANSVFGYRINGTLRSGQHGGVWFPPTASPAQMVQDNLRLFGLVSWLKAMNGPNAAFWITNTLHKQLGWSEPMLVKARQDALNGGWIVRVASPVRGRPALYRWGPTARGGTGGSREDRRQGGREGLLRITPRNQGAINLTKPFRKLFASPATARERVAKFIDELGADAVAIAQLCSSCKYSLPRVSHRFSGAPPPRSFWRRPIHDQLALPL